MKRTIFCTLRDDKGATGGPGGVLCLQKKILGESINGIPCDYWFNTLRQSTKAPFFSQIIFLCNILLFSIRVILNKNSYFFTHDIVSGAILASLGRQYSIIYHQQGPIIQEKINFGDKISKTKIYVLKKLERKAFVCAHKVYFPSNGACKMYFKNEYRSCSLKEIHVAKPLYNTFLWDSKFEEVTLLKQDASFITLFSAGTLTKAKGQDLTVAFIEKYVELSKKNIRYVLVGQGPLKKELVESLESIKQKHSNFSFFYFEQLSHNAVMYLHKISDIYIMLHRISIFDFATLEAMSQRNAIILSRVGGNTDFQKCENILFSDELEKNMQVLIDADLEELKEKNFDVFCRFFSQQSFYEQYKEIFHQIQ